MHKYSNISVQNSTNSSLTTQPSEAAPPVVQPTELRFLQAPDRTGVHPWAFGIPSSLAPIPVCPATYLAYRQTEEGLWVHPLSSYADNTARRSLLELDGKRINLRFFQPVQLTNEFPQMQQASISIREEIDTTFPTPASGPSAKP